jgi:hypothetical protein
MSQQVAMVADSKIARQLGFGGEQVHSLKVVNLVEKRLLKAN